MKVNLYITVEVSDEQRVNLGAVIDGQTKPKRMATRDEIKDFLWKYGEIWSDVLDDQYAQKFEPNPEPDEESEEDLVGDEDEEDLLG